LASTNSVKQHKLRKHIAHLSDQQGASKEFISIYLPYTAFPEQIIATLKNEKFPPAISERLKEHLQEALKKALQQLKTQKQLPQNGLAAFATIYPAEDTKKEAPTVETIAPPEPITAYQFSIDDHFNLEPLRQMLRDPKIVGILTLDAKEATFCIHVAERLELIGSISSGVPGRTGKGGQSQRRYERERAMELTSFFHRVAQHAASAFIERGVNVVLMGGPGQTKNDFLKGNYLHYELANMLLDTVDTQSAGEAGIKETLHKSEALLNNICGPQEQKIMQHLLGELRKPEGLATYGLDAVIEALSKAAVHVIVVTDDTNIVEVILVCKKCGIQKKQLTTKKTQAIQETLSPCEKCGATQYEIGERDLVDVLEDLAVQTSASVEVVVSPSEEKNALRTLGGLAALLRFKPAS